MKKCPYCGAQMNDDSLFCAECGKPFPQSNVCPHCGASMNEGDTFCQNCGKKLNELPSNVTDSTLRKCHFCGAEINDGDAFCQSCGQVLRPSFPDLIEHKANFNSGLNSIGGKIIITPTQLIFRAHAINFGNLNDRIYEIKDITGYKKGVLTFLYISFSNGKDIKLTVWNKDEIINQLEERRRALICNSEIVNPTQCNVCPHCGASMNDGDAFCGNCGRNLIDGSYANNSIINEQIQEDEEEPRRNWIPYVLGAIAIIAICGGGWWYYNSSKAPQSNNEAAVAEAVDADSVDADSVAAEAVEEDFAADTLASDIPPMEQALNAYEPILDKYIAKGESNNHYEEYYFLHDVTGDGIPELWLHVDGGESYNLLTFTYKDGQPKQISTIDVGHPSHHSFYSGSNYILIVYASMGASSWHKCEYNNGKIQDKEIFSETLSEEDENAEYKEPSETAISPIEITNKQELHNIVY